MSNVNNINNVITVNEIGKKDNSLKTSKDNKAVASSAPLSLSDKNANMAITNSIVPFIKKSFKPAQTFEELEKQIKNTDWLKDENEFNFRIKRLKSELESDDIELFSKFLYKLGGLDKDVKEKTDFYWIALCYTDDIKKNKDKQTIIENFSVEYLNKLDKQLIKNVDHISSTYLYYFGLNNTDKANELYRTINDEYKSVFEKNLYYLSNDKKQLERYIEIAQIINKSNKNMVNKIGAEKLLTSTLTIEQIQKTMEVLNNLDNETQEKFSKYFLDEIFKESHTYSAENNDKKPVAGTKEFAPFKCKEQLKTELASMKNNDGTWMFSDKQIEHIINNENDISELSKILNELAINDIELCSSDLFKILTTEGITLDIIKPNIENYLNIMDFYKDDKIKDLLLKNKEFVFNLSKEDVENFKKNSEYFNILQEYFPDEYKSYQYRILENMRDAKVSPENFKKIIDMNIYPEKLDNYQINNIIKDETFNNLDSKNIKFLQDLKKEERLSFLFDSSDYKMSLKNDDITGILTKKLPDDFDLANKSDIINFLNYIYLNNKDNDLMGTCFQADSYIDILTKNAGDTSKEGTELVDFIKNNIEINGDTYEFLTTNSFKDTLNILERIKKSPIKIDYYIANDNIKDVNNFLNILDYASQYNVFHGCDARNFEDMLICEFKEIRENKRNLNIDCKKIINNTKAKIQKNAILTKNMSLKLQNIIKFSMLEDALCDGNETFKEENISYIDNLINNPLYDDNVELYPHNVIKYFKKDMDIDSLRKYQDKRFNFIQNNPYNDNFYYDKESLIMFDGDFNKLENNIENLKRKYPKSTINMSFDEKNNVIFAIDEKKALVFDKNLNLITKIRESENNPCQVVYDKATNTTNYIIEKENINSTNKLITKYYDKDGNLSKTKTYCASDVDGVYNIVQKTPDGEVEVLSEANENSNGINIKKNLESPNGVKTNIEYNKDNIGNEDYRYIITDKNGHKLTNMHRTVKIINKNIKETTINDKKYRVEFSKNIIKIYDFTNNKTEEIDLAKINPNNNEVLTDLLKSLSGDELLKTKEYVNQLSLTDRMESGMDQITKTMHIGPHKFIFEHELGHAKDFILNDINGDITDSLLNNEDPETMIASDIELQRIFEKEEMALRKKAPKCILDKVDYFINHENHYGGKLGGLREAIAEINAMQTTPVNHSALNMRTQILQEYFPETVAYLVNNHLNKM